MDFTEFSTGKDDNGRRLDRVIRIFLSDKNLPEIYKLIRKGLIKLNHAKAKPETHVLQGDVISIASFLLQNTENSSLCDSQTQNSNSKNSLKIVFENQHLLIIDKPYDVTVHGEKDGLYKLVLDYYNSKKNKCTSLSFKPGPLHRLDRRTTGLLVFSMSLEGARYFTQGIKNHSISKKYYALAQGDIQKNELWNDFIKAQDSKNSLQNDSQQGFKTVLAASKALDSDYQNAITAVTPLAKGSLNNRTVTLCEYSIKTGRKHQIRAQSALHGFPLAGDSAYGAQKLNNANREFYLQAYSLSFPKDNPLEIPQEIKINIAPDFLSQLECCGIKKSGL